VISGTTGFLLAGLVESFGFALFGIWLTGLNWSMETSGRWSRPLARLGLATGVVLIIGLIVAPGIVLGLDDMESAQWWVWVGFVSWLGIFVLLPIWSISFGRALRRASSPASDGLVSAK
jgi:Zn-dependent protease